MLTPTANLPLSNPKRQIEPLGPKFQRTDTCPTFALHPDRGPRGTSAHPFSGNLHFEYVSVHVGRIGGVMAATFVSGRPHVWRMITKSAARASDGARYVAVAYLGTGAFEHLPLGRGDTLVVDCSERSARAGQTDPAEVRKYLNAHVNVYSYEGLHSKVYVFDDTAIIGSANASQSSRDRLEEAVVVVNDKTAVAHARQYVTTLAHQKLTRASLKAVEAVWRPPTFAPRVTSRPISHTRADPVHHGLWCVASAIVPPGHWTSRGQFVRKQRVTFHADHYAGDDSTDTASLRLPQRIQAHHREVPPSTRARHRLVSIVYNSLPPFHVGDSIIQCNFAVHGRSVAWPPAQVESVWPVPRGRPRRYIVTLRRPSDVNSVPLATLQDVAAQLGLIVPHYMDDAPCPVRSSDSERVLLSLWGSVRR